jgi:hypothetical protein
VTEISTSSSSELAKRPWRLRPWLIALGVLAILAVFQSITITLPVDGHVVDETTDQPVRGAAIAALWQLDAWSIVQKLPGGTVNVAETLTDQQGAFRFPAAFLIHSPLAPFSWQSRSDTNMPMLIVVADGYQPSSANNDVFGVHGPAHSSGLLSVRSSSLRGATLRLRPLPPAFAAEQLTEYRISLGTARTAVSLAVSSCARRGYCESNSLASVQEALARGVARTRPVR